MTEQLTTWTEKTWSGLTSFNGGDIWTDGTNIYYSNWSTQYVLNKSTSTWSTKTWTGLTSFNGTCVWTDGDNIYYSDGSTQYVLDKSTSTWSTKTWTGLTSFDGVHIWTDGDNIYYSCETTQYVLDKSTSTWSTKTWNGFNSLYGAYIWTDEDNIYYSSSPYNYVLDKSTSTWSTKTWNGFNSLIGHNIWTDGENIYYSSINSYTDSPKNYVLDKSTSTWSTKTWNGLTKFYGSKIWTDGDNIYYSDDSSQYHLVMSTPSSKPSIYINSNKIKKVYIGTVEVKKIYLGSVLVWQGLQEFVYSTGTLPTGVASLTCYRDSSQNSSASIGVISNGDPIWEGDTLHFAVTASTGYNASCNYTTTGSYTVTSDVNGVSVSSASASLKSFTITFALGGSNYGSWGSATKTAYYGDTLSISGNTVTCSGTASWTNTFTNGSATGYTYSVSYSSITSPVTATQTITATTSRSPNAYTITFSVAGGLGGSWGSSTKTAYYGDTITRSGNTVTCSGTASWTNTFTMPSNTAQYTYSRSYGSIASPVTSAQTINVTVSRTVNNYTVSFANVTGGSWNSTSGITAPYGSTISVSSNTVTVNESSRTFSISTTGYTTSYNYYLSSIGVSSGATVTGNMTITPSVGTSNKTYAIRIKFSKSYSQYWNNYYRRYIQFDNSVYSVSGFTKPTVIYIVPSTYGSTYGYSSVAAPSQYAMTASSKSGYAPYPITCYLRGGSTDGNLIDSFVVTGDTTSTIYDKTLYSNDVYFRTY